MASKTVNRLSDFRRAALSPAFVLIVSFALGAATKPAAAQDVFSPPADRARFLAVNASGAVEVDGKLDEAFWQRAEPITEFIQKDPDQGAPSSYETIVRVAYDEDALYIGAICNQPADSLRVQNLQRDFSYDDNDLFGIVIDGFLDQRNAATFQTTPYGSQRDMEVIDSSEFNPDWNVRWTVKTRIEEDHWTAEMAIPWRNLRYPADADKLGVIFARNIRHLNERTSVPATPRVFTIYRMAYEGELVGIETPPPSTNIQINPYVLAESLDDTLADSVSNQDVGGEIKWAISQSTVLDLTVNTDFAQADVDRQQVNLNRFSVFFPERRQFFLENANLFNPSVTNWIRPFFSRRIGLDDAGNPIPIDGGVRLTHRSFSQELGLLAMQQQALGLSREARFGVLRYSRNVSEQSRLGGMLTWRQDEALNQNGFTLPENQNFTYTVDGFWRPSQSFGIQAMLSASSDDELGDGLGGQLWVYYENNWLYAGLVEYYNKDYEPGVGLEILDDNYVMHSPAVNLDLRPEWLPESVRSFKPGFTAYIFQSSDNGDTLFGYTNIQPIAVEFQSGAEAQLFVEPNWQRLEDPFFPIGIEIAPGSYDYTRYGMDLESDQSAAYGAGLRVESGRYFDGDLTTYSVEGRFAPSPHFELSLDFEFNQIRDLGVNSVNEDTRLYGVNLLWAPSPQLQLSTFYQWNSVNDRGVWNARVSWEYRPLSYLYLVYNQDEIGDSNPFSARSRQQFIAKLTYLFEV